MNIFLLTHPTPLITIPSTPVKPENCPWAPPFIKMVCAHHLLPFYFSSNLFYTTNDLRKKVKTIQLYSFLLVLLTEALIDTLCNQKPFSAHFLCIFYSFQTSFCWLRNPLHQLNFPVTRPSISELLVYKIIFLICPSSKKESHWIALHLSTASWISWLYLKIQFQTFASRPLRLRSQNSSCKISLHLCVYNLYRREVHTFCFVFCAEDLQDKFTFVAL